MRYTLASPAPAAVFTDELICGTPPALMPNNFASVPLGPTMSNWTLSTPGAATAGVP